MTDDRIKIKSVNKLKKYINWCLSRDLKQRKQNKLVDYHHILPKSIFKEYKDLRKNPFNGTYLEVRDHYKAHYYLALAIDNREAVMAWYRMHNTLVSLGFGDDLEKDAKIYELLRKRYYESSEKIKEAGKEW